MKTRGKGPVAAFAAALLLSPGAALAQGGAAAQTGPPTAPLRASALARATAVWAATMRDAGRFSGAYIVDLGTGKVLFSSRASVRRAPASVEKLYTLSTALGRFGLDGQLETSVYGVGSADASGVWHGDLYLRGGGDPTFGSEQFDASAYGQGATVTALAANLLGQTQIKRVDGSIIGDESAFDSLRGEPSSGYGPDPFLTGTLSALAFNRGETGNRHTPAEFAASQLAATLRKHGIAVTGHSGGGSTPPSATLLASVASPSMSALVRLTALESDNFFAEMLLKGLGAQFGGAGTTAAGARAVRAWLRAVVGIHPHVVDGSGLSPLDQTSPQQVVTLLGALWPQGTGTLAPLGAVLSAALPVAGRSGTLAQRMRSSPAAGRCEAKTGTLTGASSLAGWCDGRFAFALMTDGISTLAAHVFQDRIVEALAGLD